jgi:hypothetical protein
MKNPSSIPVSFANKLNCSEIAASASRSLTPIAAHGYSGRVSARNSIRCRRSKRAWIRNYSAI